MHTYPADRRAGAERLGSLLRRLHVICVDRGHTHFNRLAKWRRHDLHGNPLDRPDRGGPAGFSVAAVDGRGVSWRFKPLDAAWSFGRITRPTDRRLATCACQAGASRDGRGTALVRAKMRGDVSITAVEMPTADGSDANRIEAWPEQRIFGSQLGPNPSGRKW